LNSGGGIENSAKRKLLSFDETDIFLYDVKAGVGNPFTITSCMNYGISQVGRKNNLILC